MKKITGVLVILLLLPFFLNSQSRGVRVKIKNLDVNNEVGKQYLVLIAIDQYQNWTPLIRPVKDAGDIKKILNSRFYIDEVLELYNGEATKGGIVKLFKRLQLELKPEDSVLIFFAGHGHLDDASNVGYWIPVNGGLDEDIMDKWLPNTVIKGLIKNMKSRHILLISDSCFSGELLDTGDRGKRTVNHNFFKQAYSRRSRQVLTSGAMQRVPDKSEFATQLKLVLQENTRPYLDPIKLHDEIRLGMKDTVPLLGALEGANNQNGSAFLLFLKGKGLNATQQNEYLEMAASRVTTEGREFPEKIKYKLLNNGSVQGQATLIYKKNSKQEGISSLKLTNFQGLGYNSNEWLMTYMFKNDLSIYAAFVMKGNKPIYEFRLKDMVGFDRSKYKGLIFKESESDTVVQRDSFFPYKTVDNLSILLVLSKMVSNGNLKDQYFAYILNKSRRTVDLEYMGNVNVQYQGKFVSTEWFSLKNNGIDLINYHIFKDKEGRCYPIRIQIRTRFNTVSEVKNRMVKRKLFISNLSFVDAKNLSTIYEDYIKQGIDEAITKGMNEFKKSVGDQYGVNQYSHRIPNTDTNVNDFVNIVFEPYLTRRQKVHKVFKDLMDKYQIDAFVSGHYIDDGKNPFITIRPMVFIKDKTTVLSILLQFTKEELFCKYQHNRGKLSLCKSVFDQIAWEVQQLLEQL